MRAKSLAPAAAGAHHGRIVRQDHVGRVEAPMITFALAQVAVEYGVLTSRNMASLRNALAGVETQFWVMGIGVLVLLYLIVKKM
jgi:hypothetical protein